MKKNGFSLVELSIVIVIIGLLIGGVLAGQSLIQAGKITAAVGDLSKYDSAVQKFTVKYRALPGDCQCVSPTAPGNADGVIDDNETGSFWSELSLAVDVKNKSNKNFTQLTGSYAATGFTENVHCPVLNLNLTTDAQSSANSCLMGIWDPQGLGLQSNVFYFGDLKAGPAYGSSYAGPLTPDNALALDNKMDDGIPLTGRVTGVGTTGHRCDNGAGLYNINVATGACSLRVEFGTVVGK